VRWLEDVQKDLWEMKVTRWKQNAVHTEEWESINKQAKDLTGPQSQGVSE
jgi:hypothetical protein